MQAFLAGLTVVEASREVAVRYCGRLFAQFGATVVAAPGGDDSAIGYGGEAGRAYGRWLDQGKTAQADRPADLVIGGPAPDAGDALHLALSWFHPDGPYAHWRGSDEVVQALSGVAYPFGPAEGPPLLAQGHGPSLCGALVGFNAALGALLGADRPRRLEVNILEAYLCLTETGAVSALLGGGSSVRLGVNRYVPTYPNGSYRTADGWLGVTALTPAQWRGFCGMIGRPELGPEPRFATSVERLLAADEIDRLITPALLTRTTAEWVAMGEKARAPITAMPDLRELPTVPHWAARDTFAPYDDSGRLAPTLPFAIETFGDLAPRIGRGGLGDLPLKGLKVVDFTMGWAGPLCTRTLADLGAEVIKIESEGHPDWWRGWETDQSGDPPPRETKYNFIAVNRNKRGIVLDLTTPEGLAHATTLVARADVLVENFAAGVLEALGFGREARRAINPRLIAVSMPAFGNGGPLSGTRAYGSTVEQASGLPFINGEPHWPPSLQHVAFGDPIAGLFAAAATLAVLAGRPTDGAEIDLAQVACLLQFAADGLIAQTLRDDPLPRTGTRKPRTAPVCVVAAADPDTWLAVAVYGDEAWRGLCEVIAVDPALDRRGPEIEAAIGAWAGSRDAMAAAEALQAADVSAAPIQPTHALCYDAQLASTGFWGEMERRYVGAHLVPVAPWLTDGVRPVLWGPAPTLGEHTDEVLAGLG